MIVEKTGEGKTGLAVGIGRRLCADSVSTLLMPVNLLFEEVLAARAQGKYLPFIKRMSQMKALLLDDLGLRNYTHEEACVLVDLLEDRHRKGSVNVTSQTDPRGLTKLFEDPVLAEAIVSRLEHSCQRLTLRAEVTAKKLNSKLPSGSKKFAEEKVIN